MTVWRYGRQSGTVGLDSAQVRAETAACLALRGRIGEGGPPSRVSEL